MLLIIIKIILFVSQIIIIFISILLIIVKIIIFITQIIIIYISILLKIKNKIYNTNNKIFYINNNKI
jgi:hypothetical protein